MRLSVLANPTARSGTAVRAAERAIGRLRERASEIEVHSGAVRADATESLIRMRDDRPDAVVVIGGDGTVHLAVNALAGSGVPLAVIPVGTGNDFAKDLGIPRDPEVAADVVFDGRTTAVDLARVTTDDEQRRWFATILASGFDSRVNDRANRMTWAQGRTRYNLAIAIEFALLRPIDFAMSWIDEHGVEGRLDGPLMLAAVGNTTRYGGGVPICAGADPRDGLLDVTIVHPAGRARLLRVLAAAFKGRHGRFAEVETLRVREVRLDATGLTGYADGDALAPLPLSVEAAPGALTLRVP